MSLGPSVFMWRVWMKIVLPGRIVVRIKWENTCETNVSCYFIIILLKGITIWCLIPRNNFLNLSIKFSSSLWIRKVVSDKERNKAQETERGVQPGQLCRCDSEGPLPEHCHPHWSRNAQEMRGAPWALSSPQCYQYPPPRFDVSCLNFYADDYQMVTF